MSIITNIRESAEGWRMGFSSLFRGASRTEIGTAIIGPSFAAAQQRFAAVKAGTVISAEAAVQAPVGVRYMTPSRILTSPPIEEGARVGVRNIETETPATLVEKIQRNIQKSAEGWRMGFASVAGKAKAGAEKSLAGWGMLGGKVSERISTLGGGLGSIKWLLYIVAAVLVFVAIMSSIGYSGLGGPAARMAEREHARRT